MLFHPTLKYEQNRRARQVAVLAQHVPRGLGLRSSRPRASSMASRIRLPLGETRNTANPHVDPGRANRRSTTAPNEARRVSVAPWPTRHAARRRADRNPAGPGCWEQMGLGIEQGNPGAGSASGQQHAAAPSQQGGRYQLRGTGVMALETESRQLDRDDENMRIWVPPKKSCARASAAAPATQPSSVMGNRRTSGRKPMSGPGGHRATES